MNISRQPTTDSECHQLTFLAEAALLGTVGLHERLASFAVAPGFQLSAIPSEVLASRLWKESFHL